MNARMLIRHADGAVRSIAVDSEIQIGSAPTNDIVVREAQVSPVHARVGVTDGAAWIEAASAQAGTFVNGEPVARRGLKHLDVVTVGRDVNLVFLQSEVPTVSVAAQGTVLFGGDAVVPSQLLRASDAGAPPAQTVFDPQAADLPPAGLHDLNPGDLPPKTILGFHEVGPPPKLPSQLAEADPDITRLPPPVVSPGGGRHAVEPVIIGVRLSGPAGVFEAPLGRSVVGRGSSAGVRIKSKEMSRAHAVLVVTPTEVTIEDQQSANGTSVNGSPVVGTRRLIDGDRVSFASLEFHLEILQLKRGA